MSSENIPWEYLAWDLKNHLIEMGKIKIDLNRFAEALIDLDKAIDIYPKDAFIFVNNGIEKEKNRDIIGARDDYDKAIKFNLFYIYRGYVKSRIGDIKGAVKDYEKAETLKRKYYFVFFLRGRIKELNKNFKGALKDYDDAINFNKNKTKKLFIKKANIKIEIGEHQAAIKDLTRAIKFYPANENLYIKRGTEKMAMHNLKSSIDDFNKAIEINSRSRFAYLSRGKAKELSAKDYGSIKSKIKYFKDSNKDYKKVIDISNAGRRYDKRTTSRIREMISENEKAIKVINENLY